MKNSLLALIAAASFSTGIQTASATLLVGYHTFAAGTSDSAPDEKVTNFTSVLSYSGGTVNSFGSADGWYGKDSTGQGGVAISGASANDGRLTEANGTSLTVTNNTGSNYTLTSLLFDAARANTAGLVSVGYTKGLLSGTLVSNGSVAVPTGPTNSQDYTDFIGSLGGLVLGHGQSITFTWSGTADVRLDNIALTGVLSPIPEPASLLALSALVGSGVFFRSRRRPLMSAPAVA